MIFYSFAKKILFKLIQGMKKKTKWKNSEKGYDIFRQSN